MAKKMLGEPLIPPEEQSTRSGSPFSFKGAIKATIAALNLEEGSYQANPLPSTLLANQSFHTGTSFADRTEAHGLAEGREAQIEKSLPAALERERALDLRWYQLVVHKVWRNGGKWSPLLPPQGPPPLPPEDEWLGKLPWPEGVRADQGFMVACLGFCQFIWQLPAANAMAKRCVVQKAVLGTLPVVFSTLFSITILHVQQSSTRAQGEHADGPDLFGSGNDAVRLLYLCLAMFGVAAAKVRLDYQYQIDVPLAGVRFHVRHVLQRFLLNLQVDALEAKLDRSVANKHAACRLTPGAVAQLLDPLVFEAVNHVWGFVFEVPQVVAGLLASFVAGVVTRKYYGLVIPALYVGSTLTAWLAVVFCFWYHRDAQQELAHLKVMWNIRYGGLAGAQIDAVANGAAPPTKQQIEQKVRAYGEAAFVYRKRAFQMFFMNLVFEDSVAFCQTLVYGGAFVVMALLAMNPSVSFGGEVFAAGAALLTSGMTQSSTLASDLSALVYGHAALLQLADVFNEQRRPAMLNSVTSGRQQEGVVRMEVPRR